MAAGDETVTTEVTDIRPSVNPANRSITVIVDFVNPGRWRPGASVRAEVVLEVREDAVMVPQVAIVRRPAGDVVYVIDGQGMADGAARDARPAKRRAGRDRRRPAARREGRGRWRRVLDGRQPRRDRRRVSR